VPGSKPPPFQVYDDKVDLTGSWHRAKHSLLAFWVPTLLIPHTIGLPSTLNSQFYNSDTRPSAYPRSKLRDEFGVNPTVIQLICHPLDHDPLLNQSRTARGRHWRALEACMVASLQVIWL